MNSLTDLELAAFASQMNMILKAGISPAEGILIMQEEADDEDTRTILNTMNESILTDPSFTHALAKAEVFPPYMIHMSEIGEKTGNLDTVMASLEKHYRRMDEMKRTERSAVFYPVLLTCLTIFVILVLIIEVMPVFYRVFASLGVSLTGFSLYLYALSEWNAAHHAFFFVLFGIIIVLLLLANYTAKGQAAARAFLSRFSSYQRRQSNQNAAELASTLAMTLASGLTMEEGLELASHLSEDQNRQKQLNDMEEEISHGEDIMDVFRRYKVFRPGYLHMCAIGLKTGSMPQVLEQIADLYNETLQNEAEKRIGRMEPILLIILSIVVALILFSIMFPLLNILTGL